VSPICVAPPIVRAGFTGGSIRGSIEEGYSRDRERARGRARGRGRERARGREREREREGERENEREKGGFTAHVFGLGKLRKRAQLLLGDSTAYEHPKCGWISDENCDQVEANPNPVSYSQPPFLSSVRGGSYM